MRKLLIVGATLALGAFFAPGAQADSQVIFDYIPDPLPDNVASYSYESWGVAEAGDQISF